MTELRFFNSSLDKLERIRKLWVKIVANPYSKQWIDKSIEEIPEEIGEHKRDCLIALRCIALNKRIPEVFEKKNKIRHYVKITSFKLRCYDQILRILAKLKTLTG